MVKVSKKSGSTSAYTSGSGLVIGKFMPPHLGHKYLIDFAKNYVEYLTVLVCSIKSEPIPGDLRFSWMKKMFPDVNLINFQYELPQEPSEHPNFWNIWKKHILKEIPNGVDFVFASEDYGWKLAEVLGAKYIPVNHNRDLVPISGTDIRKNPMKNWNYIPDVVRPYFLKRVCIFGPESTGKTTLAKKLAKYFNTVCVTEYARDLLDFNDGKCDYEHIPLIAKGHMASEEALAEQANKVLFSDTDALTTTIWSKALFDKCPEWLYELVENRHYDLYLLMDTDVPWIDDNQRFYKEKEQRKWFMNLCKEGLEKYDRKYIVISGNWEERFRKAVKEVKKIISQA